MDKELIETIKEVINTLEKKNTEIEIPIEQADDYVCECGNDACSSGFEPCDENGNYTEPLIGSGWDGFYICLECGRIHKVIPSK